MGKIDKSILDKIKKGNASFRFIDQTGILADGMFDEAHEIFTLEDTLDINQGEPTKTDTKLDQMSTSVLTTYESGEFMIAGTIPSMAKVLLDEFFTTKGEPVSLATGVSGTNGVKYKVASGYSLTAKQKKATVMIESEDRSVAIVFMNVSMTATFKWGSVKTEPMGIALSGEVLQNLTDNADDFYILEVGA